jgi:DNA-binding transcriptional MerR regulator
MSARSHLSIGDVLTLLRQEFPDVTISKIRFLESQGLVNPERSPSGYRKFYDHDVERLRWVLQQQREHFLPLKVIRDRLASRGAADTLEAADLPQDPAPASSDHDQPADLPLLAPGIAREEVLLGAPAHAAASHPGRSVEHQPSGVPSLGNGSPLTAAEPVHRDPPAPPPHEGSARPHQGSARRRGTGSTRSTTTTGRPNPASARLASGPQGAQPPVPEPPSPPPAPGPGAGQLRHVRPAAALPDISTVPARAPTPATPAQAAYEPEPPTPAQAAYEPEPPTPAQAAYEPRRVPSERSSEPYVSEVAEHEVAAHDPYRSVSHEPPASAPGSSGDRPSPPAAGTPGPPGSSVPASPAPSAPGPVGRTGGGGEPFGFGGGLSGASLTIEELAAASGLSPADIASLEGFGLVEPMAVAGVLYYDEEALTVATLVARFARYGVEPRHLRLYRNAVDREVGLIEQIITPLLRQRNPEARQRAIDAAAEMARLGQSLRASLLRRELNRQLGT